MTSVGETERGIGGSCHVVDSVRKEKERLTAVPRFQHSWIDESGHSWLTVLSFIL